MARASRSDWTAFQHLAVARLSEPSPVPHGMRLTARFLVLPSLDDSFAYDVIRSIRGGHVSLVRRTEWKYGLDLARHAAAAARWRTRSPDAPTLERRQLALREPSNGISMALDAVCASPIPLLPPDRTFGIAGVTYEVMFGDLHSSCRYRWWVAPPPAWRPLAKFVDLVSDLVDREFARADREAAYPPNPSRRHT